MNDTVWWRIAIATSKCAAKKVKVRKFKQQADSCDVSTCFNIFQPCVRFASAICGRWWMQRNRMAIPSQGFGWQGAEHSFERQKLPRWGPERQGEKPPILISNDVLFTFIYHSCLVVLSHILICHPQNKGFWSPLTVIVLGWVAQLPCHRKWLVLSTLCLFFVPIRKLSFVSCF